MESKGRRVLFFVAEDWYFLSHRLSLALTLKKAGHEVFVATPNSGRAKEIIQHGFYYRELPLHRNVGGLGKEFISFVNLLKIIHSVRPHHLHNIALKPSLLGTLAGRLLNVPSIICTIAGLGIVFSSNTKKAQIIQKIMLGLLCLVMRSPRVQVIFQNPDDRDLWISNGVVEKTQSHLILGSGVDTERFAFSEEQENVDKKGPVILFNSRMLRHKGVYDLVEAVRLIKKERPYLSFTLKMAGTPDAGNRASVSEAELVSWHKEGLIDWIGHQKDMPELMRKAHIVCLPSYYREGVPAALIEAASSGRAIVTTDMPGCREIVQHEQNGLLVPVKNPRLLANALTRLLESDLERKNMGKKGRELVLKQFSKEKVNDQTLEVYRCAE